MLYRQEATEASRSFVRRMQTVVAPSKLRLSLLAALLFLTSWYGIEIRRDLESSSVSRRLDERVLQTGGAEVAWILSFPHSGSSYVSNILRAVVPSQGAPSAPFEYVQTHCGGIEFSDRHPDAYMVGPERFVVDCLKIPIEGASQYVDNISEVKKIAHLVRNPLDNVIARFRYELDLHSALPRAEEPQKQEAPVVEGGVLPEEDDPPPRWIEGSRYTPDFIGFQQWCKDTDERFRDEELRRYPLKVFALALRIPCHSEFFKYVQWHNNAFAIKDSMAFVEEESFHYKDLGGGGVVGRLLEFLKLGDSNQSNIPMFHFQSFYKLYYSPDQMDAIAMFCKELASQKTWLEIGVYFENESIQT